MVGELIGKYRVVEQVGRGGMGTVFRAVDETLHRDVALKMLNADLNDPALGRRFRAEAVAIRSKASSPGAARSPPNERPSWRSKRSRRWHTPITWG